MKITSTFVVVVACIASLTSVMSVDAKTPKVPPTELQIGIKKKAENCVRESKNGYR